MKSWPRHHKQLGILTVLVLALCVVAYIILLRPKQQEVSSTRKQVEELLGELRPKGWPLDPDRLEGLKEVRSGELARFVTLSDDVLRDATSMFDRNISFFGSLGEFRDAVTRLQYQEEYMQFEQHFRAQNLVFAEEILNLSENTESFYMYQLVLQLWTVQALCDLALRHQLEPVRNPDVRVMGEVGGGRLAAEVSALPMRSYYAHKDATEPYILEFPVQLVLQGKIQNLVEFLRSLHTEDRFFPVSRLELRKVVPPPDKPALDAIEVTVQCSSFYRLSDKLPDREKPALVAPPGA